MNEVVSVSVKTIPKVPNSKTSTKFNTTKMVDPEKGTPRINSFCPFSLELEPFEVVHCTPYIFKRNLNVCQHNNR